MNEPQNDEANGEDGDGGWLGNAGQGASVLDQVAVPGGAFDVGKIVPAEIALEVGVVLATRAAAVKFHPPRSRPPRRPK